MAERRSRRRSSKGSRGPGANPGPDATPSTAIAGLVTREVVEAALAARFPEARVTRLELLGHDGARTGDGTAKGSGYGAAVHVTVALPAGEQDLVVRTVTPNRYGHDRRADRAAAVLLSYDTFGALPHHVRALDVGALEPGGPISLHDAGELYLITTFAPGRLYAEDLRQVAERGIALPLDRERCDALARYLVELHRQVPEDRPPGPTYTRAVRDLVGHGEGIFGVVDGYPPEVPAAPAARLREIERRTVEWRWRLRERSHRLRRTHGDFHPFNVLFDAGASFTLVDTSRGAEGDPADDVTCLAVNFVFFALEAPQAWPRGLGALWHRFWRVYLDESGDGELLDVAAPFLAWRGLVLASPSFYPALTASARDRLLGLIERTLAAPRFDPRWADELFPGAART